MSLITTHILDTSQGRPAQGVVVTLSRQKTDRQHWETLASGTTNADGRIADLLPDSTTLEAGIFRLRFPVEERVQSDGRIRKWTFVSKFKIRNNIIMFLCCSIPSATRPTEAVKLHVRRFRPIRP